MSAKFIGKKFSADIYPSKYLVMKQPSLGVFLGLSVLLNRTSSRLLASATKLNWRR